MHKRDLFQSDMIHADVFPDVTPLYGYTVRPMFATVRLGPTTSNIIQRGKLKNTPLHEFVMGYRNTQSNLQDIWDFYNRMSGGYGSFSFFCFDGNIQYTTESIGTGDGSNTIFQVGAKETSGLLIYKNGTLQTLTTHYTVQSGGGIDGQDQITFVSAPADGDAITATYTGRKYYERCIFSEDEMNRQSLESGVYVTGFSVMEIRA